MSVVTAKFRCVQKADCASNYGAAVPAQRTTAIVKLAAVAGPENKPWSQFTPCGTVEMQIDNPAAFDAFVVGMDYVLTFTPDAPQSL